MFAQMESPYNIYFEVRLGTKNSCQPVLVEVMLRDNVPLSRFGNPQEIANLFVSCFTIKLLVTGSIWTLDRQVHS